MKALISVILFSGALNISIHAQITELSNVATTQPEYVGWDGTGSSKALEIQNKFPSESIIFSTNGSGSGTTATPKMTIFGSSGLDDGYVGIGSTTPAVILDIYPTEDHTGYGINGTTILQNWGAGNLFCGENAGKDNTPGGSGSSVGKQHAFFGFDAGATNQDGQANTFIGYSAGKLNVSGGGAAAPNRHGSAFESICEDRLSQ